MPTGGRRDEEGRALEERAVGDRGVDPGQVLEDGPAGTQVEVPHLGVAHLSRRQADGILGRAEDGVRPVARADRARSASAPRRWRPRRVGADPEAVEDDEDDRSGSARSVPRLDARSRAAPRAAAVSPARATIPAISSGFSEAPPTSAPSIAGSARNSAMFADVTLPPYRTGTSAAAAASRACPATVRIASAIADASAPLAFRPVPIAQTGS